MLAAVVIVVLGSSGSSSSGPPAALDESTPPHYSAQIARCTKVLEKLPIDLGRLEPRIVHTTPESPAVVAWGDPAVILRCGVDRPAALHPGSSAQFFPGGSVTLGPYFDVVKDDDGGHVWTSVDRAAYVSVTIPSTYQGSTIMPVLGRAIRRALPAVCAAAPAAHVATTALCDQRP